MQQFDSREVEDMRAGLVWFGRIGLILMCTFANENDVATGINELIDP